jgi:hypothetical protein
MTLAPPGCKRDVDVAVAHGGNLLAYAVDVVGSVIAALWRVVAESVLALLCPAFGIPRVVGGNPDGKGGLMIAQRVDQRRVSGRRVLTDDDRDEGDPGQPE